MATEHGGTEKTTWCCSGKFTNRFHRELALDASAPKKLCHGFHGLDEKIGVIREIRSKFFLLAEFRDRN
jgi:hypothetical protein